MKAVVICMITAVLGGCMTVREEDQAAWRGRPVSELQLHPVFATMKLVRTRADDGTELWNFVNGRQVSSCSGDGLIFGGYLSTVQYAQFTSCMSGHAACNNLFYVKGGRVLDYVPTGSGGMRCYTDERTQPGFRGATNFT